MRVKTEDIAKFGQLYLQKGKWKGQQILSEEWIEEATRKQTDNSNHSKSPHNTQGYGYQFWRCQPQNMYRGDGAYGQLCIVMPEQDVVLAITGQSWNTKNSLQLIWESLLPAITNNQVLAENPAENGALKNALKQLELPVTKGSVRSTLTERYHTKRFAMDENPYGIQEIFFLFSKDKCTVIFQTEKGEVKPGFGWENWILNNETYQNLFPIVRLTEAPSKMAGTATWLTDNQLLLTVQLLEEMHTDKYTCTFNGEALSISFLNSVTENMKTPPEMREKLVGVLKN